MQALFSVKYYHSIEVSSELDFQISWLNRGDQNTLVSVKSKGRIATIL